MLGANDEDCDLNRKKRLGSTARWRDAFESGVTIIAFYPSPGSAWRCLPAAGLVEPNFDSKGTSGGLMLGFGT